MARAGPDARGRRWWCAAAVAAGMATATKYTAGLLLLPLLAPLLMPAASPSVRTSAGERSRRAACLLLTWAATFVLLTPGSVLEPVKFFQDLKFERLHYLQHGHYGFTVQTGMQHYLLMLRYLATELFSTWWPISLAVVALIGLGSWKRLREDPRRLAIFLLFPLVYLVYFGLTRVLFVRNLLVLAPYLALLAADGATLLVESLRGTRWRRPALALLVAMPVVNGVQLVRAARTLPEPSVREAAEQGVPSRQDDLARELAGWMEARPELRVLASPRVAAALERSGAGPLRGLTRDASQAVEAWAVFSGEGPAWGGWKSNVPGAFLAEFGPQDVNYPWYTSWPSARLLVLTPGSAGELGIRME
jgi:hypothetical protein